MRPASCNPLPTCEAPRIGVTGSCMSATIRAMSSSLCPSLSCSASRIDIVSIDINVFEAACKHSPQFAEIWLALLAPTLLVAYQLAIGSRRHPQVLGARRCPFAVAPRGRSFPPEDRPPPSQGLIGGDRIGT